MTRMTWDAVGSRVYETGVDRGVLYLPNRVGVPWNGLTGVTEDRAGNAPEPRYADGVKYMDDADVDDFSATLTAVTYPKEFLPFDGVAPYGGGLYLDSQPVGFFSLSYRTLIGSDLSPSAGYKIHILYNLTAVPTAKANASQTNTPNAMDFSWALSAVPEVTPGFRPTAHVYLDSREVTPAKLTTIEDTLYGSTSALPRLPGLVELMSMV